MWKKSVAALLLVVPLVAMSEEIATCRNPAGKGFIHFGGLVKKSDSKWTDDKVSGGIFTLSQTGDGSLDLLYMDWRTKPISSTQDGGLVRPLRLSQNSITVLVNYKSVSELYTFFVDKDNKAKFVYMQDKGGDDILVPKSHVLIGDCDSLNLDLLKR